MNTKANINSFQSLESAYLKAEMECMRLKAVYDEACEDMGRKPARPATTLQDQSRTAHIASDALESNPDLLRRLISFVHPDKHGNSLIANELTKELLKIRDGS